MKNSIVYCLLHSFGILFLCSNLFAQQTYPATNITSSEATLNGETPSLARGCVGFVYGTSSGSYSNDIVVEGDCSGIPSFLEEGLKSLRVSGLLPETTYYYAIYFVDVEILPECDPICTYYYYGNEESFTTLSCDPESIETSPKRLKLHKGQSDEVTVTVTCADGSPVVGGMVTAEIWPGQKRILVTPLNQNTDESGKATFRIIAKNEIGYERVRFTAAGKKKSIIVKVVQ